MSVSLSSQPFGALIRRARERLGLKQVTLAARLKITQGYLSRLETGERVDPSNALLLGFERELGIPVDQLVRALPEEARPLLPPDPVLDAYCDWLLRDVPEEDRPDLVELVHANWSALDELVKCQTAKRLVEEGALPSEVYQRWLAGRVRRANEQAS